MNYLRSLAIAMALAVLMVTAIPASLAQTEPAADPAATNAEVTSDPEMKKPGKKMMKKKKVIKKVKKVKGKKVVKKKVKKAKKIKKMKKLKPEMDEGTALPAGDAGVAAPGALVAQHTVHIKDFSFQLPTLTIKKGETVEFIQDDEIGHTVSTDPHPEHTQLPGFVSDVLAKGQKFTYTFNDVGTWTYHCSPHPSMKGTIVVAE